MAYHLEQLVSSGTSATDGDAVKMPTSTALVQAYLDADGGTASCILYGRLTSSSPWVTIATFTLSGASDHAEWLVDGEPWAELKGRVDTISGTGALATMEVGF